MLSRLKSLPVSLWSTSAYACHATVVLTGLWANCYDHVKTPLRQS